jgi:hypothetical protein
VDRINVILNYTVYTVIVIDHVGPSHKHTVQY